MNDRSERLPPHNREAERALLSSMLRDPSLIPEVAMSTKADEFYVYGHQKIYEAITGLNDQGKQADIVTVAEWMMSAKTIDDAGGPAYLAELWDSAPSAAHYRQYAELVKHSWTRREVIHAGTEMQRDAYDPTTPSAELLEAAERRVLQIAEATVTNTNCTVAEALRGSYERLDVRTGRAKLGDSHGVPTGLLDLDELLCGFQPNELIIVAARPSVGKTAFGLQCAATASVDHSIATLFVSLEQARTELTDRLLCSYAQINSYKMRRGFITGDEQGKLMDAGAKIGEGPLFFDDGNQQGMMRIASNARRLKSRKGLGIVFVDYLQLIDPDNPRANRQEQVSAISRRLKSLARELEIPVVAMAQLNRGTEDRSGGRPRLSDLRESGAIEQDADTVILLHRADEENGVIEAIVAKQRNGPTGDAKLLYRKEYMRFDNYATPMHGGKW